MDRDRTDRLRLRSGTALAVALALTVSGCTDDPVVPPGGPAEFQVTLISPNGPEGAALIEIDQTGLRPITVLGGDAFSQQLGDVTRLVIVLTDPGQIAFLMRVDDAAVLPTAKVLEVADADDELRASVTGYRVDFNTVNAGTAQAGDVAR